ncbi:single-stranded DNA-binding protein [Corynebacterium suicordis]|uniref:single-stranded DNA-binding protein n=1 Tax=uncultured Corynebacterium sp. TaxID=159447 RepID=UPI0025982F4A|nr:single-stranded DNA-binding protein [uncultured Corynebacterium sp.]
MSMDQAQMFIAGRIASDPKWKQVGENSHVVEFRVATNHSYKDRDGEWKDGDSSFFQVQCWDRLGQNVFASLHKGYPVIAYGRMVQSSWTVTDHLGREETRSILRLRASYVGPDLNQREVTVLADKAKRAQEAQQSSQQTIQQSDEDSYPEALRSSAPVEGDGRELPVDRDVFAGASTGQ